MPNKIDIQLIANSIQHDFPDIAFAYLFGSAQEGVVKDGSDIDIAIYYKGNDTFIRLNVIEALEQVVGRSLPIDVIELQKANTLLAFKAISGKLLFVRDNEMENYADFYTLTRRKYEDETYWMKKQLEYRGYEVQWNS